MLRLSQGIPQGTIDLPQVKMDAPRVTMNLPQVTMDALMTTSSLASDCRPQGRGGGHVT